MRNRVPSPHEVGPARWRWSPLGSRRPAARFASRFAETCLSGAILLAAALGGDCSAGTGIGETGSLRIVVTGLDPTLTAAGQVTVTALDVTGFTPRTIDLPGNGDSGELPAIPVGTYQLAYTPPSDYGLAVGEPNPKEAEISANVSTTVTWLVMQDGSTVRVTVTGLPPGGTSGGAVTILRTDLPGQSPTILEVPASGSAELGVHAGTYSVTYAPPTGSNLAAGIQNPQVVTATAGHVAVASFAVTSATGFQTPDIVDNASFETGWDGFSNGGGGSPTGVTRSTEHAFSGAYGVKKVLPTTQGSDVGGTFIYPYYDIGPGKTYDRLWGRFYFYFDAAVNGTFKFQIWEGTSDQYGGFYLMDGYVGWWFVDWAWSSAGMCALTPLSELLSGWHSLEVDYWRNGDPSGWPSVGLWLDGEQLTRCQGSPPAPGYWSGGRLYAGRRQTQSGNATGLGTYNLLGVLNGTPANTVPGDVWVDRVSVSSVGRIGQ
jgi:hypothetical protein